MDCSLPNSNSGPYRLSRQWLSVSLVHTPSWTEPYVWQYLESASGPSRQQLTCTTCCKLQAQAIQAQPSQLALNQAILGRLSQIEQRLQTGGMSPSSRGDDAEVSEVLQAMQVRSCCCRSCLWFTCLPACILLAAQTSANSSVVAVQGLEQHSFAGTFANQQRVWPCLK